MEPANILIPLYILFGSREFLINSIADENLLWDIGAELNCNATTINGVKTQLGKWLTQNADVSFRLPSGETISISVLRRANDSIPGIYQIHQSP